MDTSSQRVPEGRRLVFVGLMVGLGLAVGACQAAEQKLPAPADVPAADATQVMAETPTGAPAAIEARLSAAALPHEPHWIQLDAAGSIDPDRRIAEYAFWMTDATSGETIRGPVEAGTSLHGFALGPGTYEAHVKAVTHDGVESSASQTVEVSSQEVVTTERGTPCSLGNDAQFSCTMVRNNAPVPPAAVGPGLGRLVAALLERLVPGRAFAQDETDTASDSGSTESLSSLLSTYQSWLKSSGSSQTVSDADIIWIEAYGAGGGNGGTSTFWSNGGSGASGGQALTVTSIADFEAKFGTDSIAYYLGANGHHVKGAASGGDGGASTIVRANPSSDSTVATTLVLIAGGGGGGGSAGADDGHDGGRGGCALATSDGGSAVSGKGSDGGGGHQGDGGNGESGGGTNGNTKCGDPGTPAASSGDGGFGGYGGAGSVSDRYWNNATPGKLASWDGSLATDGHGGHSDYCGGGGGGGYGGGGGGAQYSGGGGGGSYAIGATAADSSVPTSCSTSGSADGVVRVIFTSNMSN